MSLQKSMWISIAIFCWITEKFPKFLLTDGLVDEQSMFYPYRPSDLIRNHMLFYSRTWINPEISTGIGFGNKRPHTVLCHSYTIFGTSKSAEKRVD